MQSRYPTESGAGMKMLILSADRFEDSDCAQSRHSRRPDPETGHELLHDPEA
jgi:hypothetical protein